MQRSPQMTNLIFILVLCVAIIVAFTFTKASEQNFAGRLEELARTLGLECFYSSARLPRLEGTIDGVRVTLRMNGDIAQITADPRGKIPRTLRLRPKVLKGRMGQLIGQQDIELGDDAFDEAVLVEGDETRAIAALDRETRKNVSLFVTMGGTVSSGLVRGRVANMRMEPSKAVGTVQLMLKIAKGLALPADPEDHLLLNAKKDPRPLVRLRNLAELVHYAPASTTTSQALKHGLGDASPKVQLYAAARLGRPAFPELARLAGNTKLKPSLRVHAIKTMARWVGEAEVRAPILALLSDRSEDVKAAAIGSLKTTRAKEVTDRLIRECKSASRGVAKALVNTLAGRQHPEFESAMLTLLACDGTAANVAAAKVLAAQGTIKAVEPLMEVSKGRGSDTDLKMAAREAIVRIQGRAGQRERGGLAVVHGKQGGGLAIAAEAGALATPEKLKQGELDFGEEVGEVESDSVSQDTGFA